jgi:nicotinate-nucleotide pyrophosphorylase (carboxylating)
VTGTFRPAEWDVQTADDCRHIIRLAVREDLGRGLDLTTVALVPRDARGEADVVARRSGIVAGLPAAMLVLDEMQLDAEWQPRVEDGAKVADGSVLATLRGSTRDLLTAERTLLNLLGRLCGVATLTRRYVDAIAGTSARIYDTRKTTPGWRRMEKYAVRCGGGTNHRTGLFDAILIKDNHLAQTARATGSTLSPADAVIRAREFLQEFYANGGSAGIPIEVEVDTLDQFANVLQLRIAVKQRNDAGVKTELEASGGIHLETVRAVAETGIDRISVGALTHSAVALDVALDWIT